MQHAPRMLDGSVITTNCDACIFSGVCLGQPQSEPFAIVWLRQIGEAISEMCIEVTARPDGQEGGRLALDFPSFGDCTTAAMHLNTLKAMMKVDRG